MSRICRVFAVAFCAALFALQSVTLLLDHYKYPSDQKVLIVVNDYFWFPTITFCFRSIRELNLHYVTVECMFVFDGEIFESEDCNVEFSKFFVLKEGDKTLFCNNYFHEIAMPFRKFQLKKPASTVGIMFKTRKVPFVAVHSNLYPTQLRLQDFYTLGCLGHFNVHVTGRFCCRRRTTPTAWIIQIRQIQKKFRKIIAFLIAI